MPFDILETVPGCMAADYRRPQTQHGLSVILYNILWIANDNKPHAKHVPKHNRRQCDVSLCHN